MDAEMHRHESGTTPRAPSSRRRLGRAVAVVVALCVIGVPAATAFAATSSDPLPQRAVLNGVMDVKKGKVGRFNFRLHMTQGGALTAHGDFNGGVGKYLLAVSFSSFACSAGHLAAAGTGLLNGTTTVSFTITADDHGLGVASPDDVFTIDWPGFHKTGSPIAGKVFLKNC
jgi:hypothetical protein